MGENQSYFATLIIVVLAALAAALLLVVALVVWLAELMGSAIYPCLILGIFMAILAAIVYRVSLRHIVREIDERLSVIYEVTKILREGIEWCMRVLFRTSRE
jgi:hypothetical protein